MIASMPNVKWTFSDAVILLAFQGLNNVFCVYTEVMAQDVIVIFLNKITPNFQLLPMSKVYQS